VVVEELYKFAVLLREVGKVYEEPTAHVSLHCLDLFWPSRSVALNQEVAILEESSSSDLLGVLSSNQLLVKVIQSFLEISIN
jgi:hypothetical protein